jgi:hypothetical protein
LHVRNRDLLADRALFSDIHPSTKNSPEGETRTTLLMGSLVSVRVGIELWLTADDIEDGRFATITNDGVYAEGLAKKEIPQVVLKCNEQSKVDGASYDYTPKRLCGTSCYSEATNYKKPSERPQSFITLHFYALS